MHSIGTGWLQGATYVISTINSSPSRLSARKSPGIKPSSAARVLYCLSFFSADKHSGSGIYCIHKKSSEKRRKKSELVRISHWSDSDENAMNCKIACDCVKRANVVVGLRKENFARTHTATHKPRFAQRLIVTKMTHKHLMIVCGAPRPTAWRGNTGNHFIHGHLLIMKHCAFGVKDCGSQP